MAWIMIPKPKTAKGRSIVGIVLACFGLLAAVVVLTTGISGMEEVPITALKECACADIDTDHAYEFEDVWLIGEYATWIVEEDGSDHETSYYMVAFTDRDDELCYASVEANPGSDFGKKCAKAVEEDTTLELTGIYTCKELTSLDDKIEKFYHNAYKDCITEAYGKNISMNFTYKGEDEAAFREENRNGAIICFVMAGVFAVGSALALFLIIRNLKKIKREEAENAAAQAACQAAYNGGYPPNNYPNPGYNGDANGGFYDNNGNNQGQ